MAGGLFVLPKMHKITQNSLLKKHGIFCLTFSKTSMNSARHINSIDFFDVILYDMINAQVLYAGLDPGPGKSAL